MACLYMYDLCRASGKSFKKDVKGMTKKLPRVNLGAFSLALHETALILSTSYTATEQSH